MKLLLAPMEGVVDFVMRDLITRIGGFDYCATEFVRVTSLLLPDHVFYKYCPELKMGGKTAAGTPVFVQLLGGQPGPMAENAAKAASLGAPGIDINFGCPAKTVNRHDGGSVILKCPDRVFNITKQMREAVPKEIPVTVKIRLGFEDDSLAVENSIAAQEAGAHWLTVHARTKVQGYKPPANWEALAKIQEVLNIPLNANGDIWTLDDYKRCKEVTGCENFMLGRGAIADPFLASKIKNYVTESSWDSMDPWLPQFVEDSRDFRSEKYAVMRTKQWTRLLARNYPEAGELFEEIKRLQEFDEVMPPVRHSVLKDGQARVLN